MLSITRLFFVALVSAGIVAGSAGVAMAGCAYHSAKTTTASTDDGQSIADSSVVKTEDSSN